MSTQKPSNKELQQEQAAHLEISELISRLRLLEERYGRLSSKSQFVEQNMLRDAKEISDELSIINETTMELKRDIADLNEKLLKLVEEMKDTVKKNEFNVLAKYLNFWQPLNFLTREEAEKLLKDLK